MAAATDKELNQFVKVVDDFYKQRAMLIKKRGAVMATGDAKLIADYNTAVNRANTLASTIQSTVGAWNAFKEGYGKVTAATSTVIGDAIDEIRSWFGYEPAPGIGCYQPGLGNLGAVQIPAAAWVAGIIASALVLTKSIREILIRIEASRIQKEDGVTRATAIQRATEAYDTGFLGGKVNWALIAVAAGAAYFFLSERK